MSANMLLVGPHLDRPQSSSFQAWSVRFADQFQRLGWTVTIFPYKDVYLPDVVLRLSRNRLKWTARRKLHRELMRVCTKVQPQVIFLEKAELISPAWLVHLRSLPHRPLIVFFNPDDPQAFEWLGRRLGALADVVLTSSQLCIPMYKDLGVPSVHYVPFWAEPTVRLETAQIGAEFKCDVAFAGTHYPERSLIFERLCGPLAEKNIGLKIWGAGWEDASKAVKNSMWTGSAITNDHDLRRMLQGCTIALNIHHVWMKYGGMKSNVRTYEAMSNGAFVLSDETVGMSDLFEIGKELVCYKDAEDAVAKIEYYLHNAEERKAIAERGSATLRNRYTLEHWIRNANEIIHSNL